MSKRSASEWELWERQLAQEGYEEAWRGIQCFFRWIEIRAENGHAVPSFLVGLEEDVKHSSLLRRLISGKEPLPEAPPESFGQPWYELIENGRAIATEVEPWEWAPEKKLTINKGVWTIVEKINEADYLVCFREPGDRFRISRERDHWLISRQIKA
ncbi:hypothetical protein KIH39_17505 [Telmatocola sphagniphila]|uniref:Uncharacterized protein n=1 Tax=Telmatocola sphagniphila TaxID=1123043 RepID=A0A8E6EWX2_9BACT|nr:hypothetical protein [Telmatocola sphagniphila]QVL30641.1 hypothetical protein KIH39_17505 [Telmatocola sphagniphila]